MQFSVPHDLQLFIFYGYAFSHIAPKRHYSILENRAIRFVSIMSYVTIVHNDRSSLKDELILYKIGPSKAEVRSSNPLECAILYLKNSVRTIVHFEVLLQNHVHTLYAFFMCNTDSKGVFNKLLTLPRLSFLYPSDLVQPEPSHNEFLLRSLCAVLGMETCRSWNLPRIVDETP